MREDLVSILYTSSIIINYKNDIKYTLKEFQESNKKHNITGILLYSEGNVIQYIEGPRSEIAVLYNNIISDTRHKSIITLLYNKIEQRVFPEWSMTYKKIDLVVFNDIKTKEIEIIKNFMIYNMDRSNLNIKH